MIELKIEDKIATITLNRPEKRNALNSDMVRGLKAAFEEANASEVKIIHLRAEGDVFCAGADLAHMESLATFGPEQNLVDSTELKDALLSIWLSPKLVLAEIAGAAIAGGTGLASVCDYVVAAPDAKFGYVETKIGFAPAIVSIFAIEKLGQAKANPLLLLGDLFGAEKALEVGIVNEIVAKEALSSHCLALLGKWSKGISTNSLTKTKAFIRSLGRANLEANLVAACEMNVVVRSSDDFKTGIRAVLEKRKLEW